MGLERATPFPEVQEAEPPGVTPVPLVPSPLLIKLLFSFNPAPQQGWAGFCILLP